MTTAAATTYQNVLDAARYTLADDSKVRYPDLELLVYLNDALYEMVAFRSDLFIVTGDIPCVAGSCEQTVPSPGKTIVGIYGIKGGTSVDRTDLNTLRRFRPSWRADTAGPAQNWLRSPEDESKQANNGFLIYPQAPSNQTLQGQWIQPPSRVGDLTAAGVTFLPVPDDYRPALEFYVISRAESKDDEYAVGERAPAFLMRFKELIHAADLSEDTKPYDTEYQGGKQQQQGAQ